MEQKVSNFFHTLGFKKNADHSRTNTSSSPQIGFKVSFCQSNSLLTVKVIGARQLPSDYGGQQPKGYIVKVTVFPGKQKYETKIVAESWPIFNEEFQFPLQSNSKYRTLDECIKSMFVSLTIYALLEDKNDQISDKNTIFSVNDLLQKGTKLKRFLSLNENDKDEVTLRKHDNKTASRSSYRCSLNARRTVGVVTYLLDKKLFTQILRGNTISTPDIWRTLKDTTTGVNARDGNKGGVEVTFTYALSEDGTNDVMEITLNKFRCSIQTMQEHEKIGGQLYIKIYAFESEEMLQSKKSDKFSPTISLKMDSSTSTLRATVNKYKLNEMKIFIKLMSKNMISQKTQLGAIEIDNTSEIWRDVVAVPSTPVTKMIHFL